MERRRVTREFKFEAVRLIRDRGVSYVQASEDLRVRFETHSRGLKTALIAGRQRSNTRFCAFGFSKEPIKAGRHRVSKRTLKVHPTQLRNW